MKDQLKLDSEQHLFKYGSGTTIGNTKKCDIIFNLNLNFFAKIIYFSKNNNDYPKIHSSVGPEGSGKTETLKVLSILSGY